MTEPLPNYPPTQLPDAVAKSVSRESAFSKPGQAKAGKGSSKGWAPAKGTRFRSLTVKSKVRKRKNPPDPRRVTFY